MVILSLTLRQDTLPWAKPLLVATETKVETFFFRWAGWMPPSLLETVSQTVGSILQRTDWNSSQLER